MDITNMILTVLCCIQPYGGIMVIFGIYTTREKLKFAAKISKDIAKDPNDDKSPRAKRIRLYIISAGVIIIGLLITLLILATYVLFPSILASLPSTQISLIGISFLLIAIFAGLFSIIVYKRILDK